MLCSDPDRYRLKWKRGSCLGRRHLCQLEENVAAREVFKCLVTVRYIHKVSISCLCSGCGSPVTRGSCTYVGCHWNGANKVDLKAW